MHNNDNQSSFSEEESEEESNQVLGNKAKAQMISVDELLNYASQHFNALQYIAKKVLKETIIDNFNTATFTPDQKHKLYILGTEDVIPTDFYEYLQTDRQFVASRLPNPVSDPVPIYPDIVKNVFTEYIRIENNVLLNSVTQVKNAVKLIDLSSNVQIGMFMLVCKEVGAVRPNISDVDFVRALRGIGIIPVDTPDAQINRIVDGFQNKINGFRRNGKFIPGLAPNHILWKSESDRRLGNDLYAHLIKKL